ncbi:hypothetical protein AB0H83_29350 [Dactylosporangium sp. NPDC050688]|uniref:hypothetical protein n=1 Tax=Dactylosporangium sp. NPDC050688 TaxID=3157217 RepID=UPI0033D87C65
MDHELIRFDRVATDRGVHNDLELRLGRYRHTADSYYLAIDDSPTAGAAVEENLARLLAQWIDRLHGLAAGGKALLPYDFSDQCTAWLHVQSPDGRTAVVQAGWSGIEGWSFMPTNIDQGQRPRHLQPIAEARIECRLADLVAALERNRDDLRGRLQ